MKILNKKFFFMRTGRFFRFLQFSKEILKGIWKSLKNSINQLKWIFLSKFSCSMFTADKRHAFLFTKNEKINFKPLKHKNPFTFLNFPRFLKDSTNALRSVNDCSVKQYLQTIFSKFKSTIDNKNFRHQKVHS